MKAGGHYGLHKVKRRLACAVAGIKPDGKRRKEPGGLADRGDLAVGIFRVFHHMESADYGAWEAAEYIFITVEDIDDAVVGASREKHTGIAFFYDKALLMGEAVEDEVSADLFTERKIALGPKPPAGHRREKGELVIYLIYIGVDEFESGKVKDGFVDADVFLTMVKIAGSTAAHIYPCGRGEGHEADDAACMVIVPVADDDGVGFCDVRAEGCGIFPRQRRCAGIHYYVMLRGLDIKAQAVLGVYTVFTAGVLHQYCYFHYIHHDF